MEPIDKRHHGTIISRIKVMSELDIAEKRVPQDGRFKLRVRGPHDRLPRLDHADGARRGLRSSASSTRSRPTPSSRACTSTSSASTPRPRRSCASSSASPTAWCSSPGPTGSGKTTTLYACLSEIQSVEDKIVTIEDPVEYQLRGITQIPVNEKKGLTFARGLRSILRHDPDKIMVGEIRDEETAQIAVQSALTGHLVFTTVHANNVVDVLGRFLNMKVELYNFVSALNCVLAQRLVRKICPHCKEPVDGHAARRCSRRASIRTRCGDGTFYEGKGCLECNGTGFHGRMAIAELLDLSDRIRGLILERRPAAEIKKAAKEEGMIFLRDAALAKVFEGLTTLKEINKVTFVD